MSKQSRVIPISTDVIDLPGNGMFATADWRVINRMGVNYYMTCGEIVLEKAEGGHTTCIKPIYHVTWQHEDFEGRINGYGTLGVEDIDSQTRSRARDILKSTGLDDEQIYNALNGLFYDGINITKESR